MVYQDGWKIGVNYTKECNGLLSKNNNLMQVYAVKPNHFVVWFSLFYAFYKKRGVFAHFVSSKYLN